MRIGWATLGWSIGENVRSVDSSNIDDVLDGFFMPNLKKYTPTCTAACYYGPIPRYQTAIYQEAI